MFGEKVERSGGGQVLASLATPVARPGVSVAPPGDSSSPSVLRKLRGLLGSVAGPRGLACAANALAGIKVTLILPIR